MNRILSSSKKDAIASIDALIQTYCHDCLLKRHIRQSQSKTQAHYFCITTCSVGKQIKQIGNELQ